MSESVIDRGGASEAIREAVARLAEAEAGGHVVVVDYILCAHYVDMETGDAGYVTHATGAPHVTIGLTDMLMRELDDEDE